jgi:hypothetical protein
VWKLTQLFRVAGWKTTFLTSDSVSRSTDKSLMAGPLFDAGPTSFTSVDSRQRMQQGLDDLRASLESKANLGKRLRDLSKVEPAVSANNEDESTVAVSQSKDSPVMLLEEVPKSFEEIYQLSGRNRKKNKDKKRGRDVDASIDTLVDTSVNVSSQDQKDKDFDYNQYFVQPTGDADVTVDGTVS